MPCREIISILYSSIKSERKAYKEYMRNHISILYSSIKRGALRLRHSLRDIISILYSSIKRELARGKVVEEIIFQFYIVRLKDWKYAENGTRPHISILYSSIKRTIRPETERSGKNFNSI